jgi:catechol 2,3-dioxygenase-like lactoylglutathione lyase family enzyme
MKYVGALMAVEDLRRSRDFYEGVLGQAVETDFGPCVGYSGGFSIMAKSLWNEVLGLGAGRAEGPDHELYFEDDDVSRAASALEAAGAAFLHGIREQPWRQRVLRCYDPDGHLVEIGETMPGLCGRLRAEGMDPAGIARATGLPEAAVLSFLGGPEGAAR